MLLCNPLACASGFGGHRCPKLFILTAFTLGLSGCASYPFGKGDVCPALAAFANAIPSDSTHSVILETAWGPSKLAPDALSYRYCTHGGFGPGERFCAYLIRNSAAEFPEDNYINTMACLSDVPRRDGNYVTYGRLNVQASSWGAFGIKKDVEITIDFKPNDQHGTTQLTITAHKYSAF